MVVVSPGMHTFQLAVDSLNYEPATEKFMMKMQTKIFSCMEFNLARAECGIIKKSKSNHPTQKKKKHFSAKIVIYQQNLRIFLNNHQAENFT